MAPLNWLLILPDVGIRRYRLSSVYSATIIPELHFETTRWGADLDKIALFKGGNPDWLIYHLYSTYWKYSLCNHLFDGIEFMCVIFSRFMQHLLPSRYSGCDCFRVFQDEVSSPTIGYGYWPSRPQIHPPLNCPQKGRSLSIRLRSKLQNIFLQGMTATQTWSRLVRKLTSNLSFFSTKTSRWYFR